MQLKFQHLTEFDDTLEPRWNALLERSHTNTPFLRFGYLRQWWRTRGGGEWPENARLMLILAHADEQLIGIAPFFLAEHQGALTILLLGSTEISDFLDFICEPQYLHSFIAGLMEFLLADQHKSWHKLVLDNIPDASPTLSALRQWAETNKQTLTIEELHPAPCITLPGDWEIYLSGIDKKQRHEIRRKMRRAEENAPALTWRITSDLQQLEQDGATFLSLMEYDPEKAAFLTPAMRRQNLECMRWAFDENLLQLAFLEINHQPAAAYFCFDYKNVIWVYNSGFNPAFLEFSPGWVLLGYLLRWANENRRAMFDFMRGGEEYKYRFGAVRRSVMRVVLLCGV